MKLHIIQLALAITLAAAPCLAETDYVSIQVEDAQGHPVRDIEIGIDGIGGSRLTGNDGKAQIAVGKDTAPGDWITLHILHSPAGKDFVINSPWDYRSQVPSFANKPENFIKVVVVQRGDRTALESGTVLSSLAARINKANAPKTASQQAPPTDPKEALTAVAKQYDLSAVDVDKAIRAWGTKTSDPYEVGLAALYERNYPKASTALADSLQQREHELEADQKGVADAASYLGQSLYEEGHYREAAQAYQKCLTYRPDDTELLNSLALSLNYAGDYNAAEPLFRRALAMDEKTLGPDHPDVAIRLRNLALLLWEKGDNAAAEPLVQRALSIDKKNFGPDHPKIATDFNNMAVLLRDKGDYTAAEPLFRQALAIDEKALGSDHPHVARDLGNLALLFQDKGDYISAEPLLRRALAIDEKALGPDHPEVATYLGYLAELLEHNGDYHSAEPLFRRALAIDEKAFGPDHPNVAADLNHLAVLLRAEGDSAAAEPLYRRALAIKEKELGPDNPALATNLINLAVLLRDKGDYAGAEPLFRRALLIDEKALGPDNPVTKTIRENLAYMQSHPPTTHP